MNAFDAARRLEARAWVHLRPFIDKHTSGLYAPVVGGGILAQTVQRTHDVDVLYFRGEELRGLELKCEERNKWGNFFLETWSNKSFGRARDGWMMTCNANTLLYYFLEDSQLFSIPFPQLWTWAFGDSAGDRRGNLLNGRFEEKAQKRYEQLNATFGCCVPIEVIGKEVGFSEWRRQPSGEFTHVRNVGKVAAHAAVPA